MSPKERKEIDTSSYTGRFAERLRMLREKKKLSVEELAEKVGVPRKTLYNWEAQISAPSFEHLPTLADALGVSIRSLMPEK